MMNNTQTLVTAGVADDESESWNLISHVGIRKPGSEVRTSDNSARGRPRAQKTYWAVVIE